MTHVVFLPVVLMADVSLDATTLLVFNARAPGFLKNSLRWKARQGGDLIAVVTTLVTYLFIVSMRVMDLTQQTGSCCLRRLSRREDDRETKRARPTQILVNFWCVCVFASRYSEDRLSIHMHLKEMARWYGRWTCP